MKVNPSIMLKMRLLLLEQELKQEHFISQN